MKKKFFIETIALAIMISLAGCGNAPAENGQAVDDAVVANAPIDENAQAETDVTEDSIEEGDETEAPELRLDLEDGQYMVKFDTDNSMFHVNETMNGKALLTVSNGEGMLHLVMPSKNVLNLYSGFAEDAQNNEADWIKPSTEAVTYEDGMTEDVFAFDVPVYVLDEEFDLALIGKKEVWYDHKVSISNPEPVEVQNASDSSNSDADDSSTNAVNETIELSLEGGTGKVTLISPTIIKEVSDGYLVTIEWSSKNYDYMIVDDVKYLPVEVNEHSIFEIPVKDINEPLNVIADTVAMSTPHEIEYVITFSVDSMK